jgi:hypothetical protein
MSRFSLGSLVFAVSLAAGCTENSRARRFGGDMTIALEPGEDLVNVTFKDDQLWLLTRRRPPGEAPDTSHFVERSSFGLLEGKITIVEH